MTVKNVTFDLTRFGGVRALNRCERQPHSASDGVAAAASVPSVPRDRGIVNSREGKRGDKGVGKTIGVPRDTRDSQGQPALTEPLSTFRFVGEGMEFGDVCEGWTPRSWAGELKRKAECCAECRPDIADHYRRWAGDIEARLQTN